VTEVRVENVTNSQHVSLLLGLEYSNIVIKYISRYNLHFNPIGLQILPPGGHLRKHTFASIFITTVPVVITMSMSIIIVCQELQSRSLM
jgi:hypothetical protein